MLETFKARLKAKSTAAGANLSTKRIDAKADKLHAKFPDLTEEADHDAKIDDVFDEQDFKDLAAADDFQRTKEAKEKKDKADKEKADKEKADKDKSGGDADKDDDVKTMLKTLLEQNKTLSEKVAGIEKEKTTGTIKSKISSHEKVKDIPADYYSEWALPENEDAIDAFAEKVNSKYAAFQQDLVNKGLAAQPRPGGGNRSGGSGKEASEKEINSVVDKLMK